MGPRGLLALGGDDIISGRVGVMDMEDELDPASGGVDAEEAVAHARVRRPRSRSSLAEE